MPNAIEIAFYVLGVRLSQCQIFLIRTAEPSDEKDNVFGQGHYALDLLRSAFNDVVRLGLITEADARFAHRIFERCQACWDLFGKPGRTRPSSDDPNKDLSGVLLEFEALFNRLTIAHSNTEDLRFQWFRIGKTIAALDHQIAVPPPAPSGGLSALELLRELAEGVRIDVNDLLPAVAWDGSDFVLPYDNEISVFWVLSG
jgi:hypothetical protein